MTRYDAVEWTALRRAGEGRQVEVLAPRVGLWRGGPAVGDFVRPGVHIGALEVLGVLYPLVAPAGAAGLVSTVSDDPRARRPVAYGERLMVLDPEAVGSGYASPDEASALALTGRAFVAPMSGRFYVRPGPDKPSFVTAGQLIRQGETVCLLEVMKTFNRVTFGGVGMPAEARIKRVIPADGDDLNAHDPILEFEVD